MARVFFFSAIQLASLKRLFFSLFLFFPPPPRIFLGETLEQDVKQLKDENTVLKTQIVKYQTTEKYHQDMMKKVALPPGMNHRAKLGIFGGVDENMEEEEEEEEEEEGEEEREYSQLYQD